MRSEPRPQRRTRQATPQDEQVLLRFTLDEAVEAEGRAEHPEVIERAIRRALSEPEAHARYFVVEQLADQSLNQGLELLGHVSVTKEWSDWNDAHYLWITSMYVKPSARGTGAMQALLEAVDDFARSVGAPEVRIYVHKGNHRGTRAWLREGFQDAPYWMGHRAVSPNEPGAAR